MKRYLMVFLANAIFLYLSVQLIDGLSIAGNPVNWFMALAAFGVIMLASEQILRFLTLPENPLTIWALSLVLSVGGLYAMTLILPGFTITDGIIGPWRFGLIVVERYAVNQWINLIVAGIFTSCLATAFYWLEE